MKFLKRPAVATVMAVLIVLFSTVISADTKLQAQVDKVSAAFYDGVTYDGYKHPSIGDQLEVICGAADGIVSIVSDYGVDTEQLAEKSSNLRFSMSYKGDWFSSYYSLYKDLSDELVSIERKSRDLDFTERDASGMEQYLSTIENASRLITESGYNDYVRNYKNGMSETEKFFADSCDIYGPEYFA